MNLNKFVEELKTYFKAGYPSLLIRTSEENRVYDHIIENAPHPNVLVWDIINGFEPIRATRNFPKNDFQNVTEPMPALLKSITNEKRITDIFEKSPDKDETTLYIFKDFGLNPLTNPKLNRGIKELILNCRKNGSCSVFVGDIFDIPKNLERLIRIHDFPLPDKEDLKKSIDGLIKRAKESEKEIKVSSEEIEEITKAASGLNSFEAEDAFAKSIIKEEKFNSNIIYEEKVKAVKRTGFLQIIEPEKEGLNAIGGFDALKEWLLKRKSSFSKKSKEEGIPNSKGIVIIGPPGTGKSLTSKCVGTTFNKPTVRFDISKIFGRYVGDSEQNMYKALEVIEACSPCVVWIDEVEKGLAGSKSDNSSSDVTRKVFGILINWMQETKAPVFIVATANDVKSIESTFLRAGRIDKVWSTDLPTIQERKKIFEIHLEKKRTEEQKIIRKATDFDLTELVAATENYTGAEIEAVIVEGLYNAFNKNEKLKTEHILEAIEETKTLNDMSPEEIKSIQEWGKNHATSVSKKKETTSKKNSVERKFR